MIISNNDNVIIVKVYRDYYCYFNIYDINDLYSFFKNLFKNIKNKYEISGFCDVDVYTNDNFGMIIEINNTYKYEDKIDVKITFHVDNVFLVEINDIDKYDNIYYYKNRYYTYYDKKIDNNILYKDCKYIINNGIKIR